MGASRTVEVGGRGGWVRGRALAGPKGRDSSAVLSRPLSQVRVRNARAGWCGSVDPLPAWEPLILCVEIVFSVRFQSQSVDLQRDVLEQTALCF